MWAGPQSCPCRVRTRVRYFVVPGQHVLDIPMDISYSNFAGEGAALRCGVWVSCVFVY